MSLVLWKPYPFWEKKKGGDENKWSKGGTSALNISKNIPQKNPKVTYPFCDIHGCDYDSEWCFTKDDHITILLTWVILIIPKAIIAKF